MTNVDRALEQIAEIHQHLAKSQVYRGWRSAPVAASGVAGILAALWQSMSGRRLDAEGFVTYWLVIALAALALGCSEITWHYVTRANRTERRQSREVIGQFLPALAAAAIVTGAIIRLSPASTVLLPGLWAILFGVAIVSARPFIPRASGWIALYYAAAGAVLLLTCQRADALSPWSVGGTFGLGQCLAAAVLYWSLERGT